MEDGGDGGPAKERLAIDLILRYFIWKVVQLRKYENLVINKIWINLICVQEVCLESNNI
jgi:hypothetical protein